MIYEGIVGEWKPNKNGNTHAAHAVIEAGLSKSGVDSQWFHIGRKAVYGCINCGSCKATRRCALKADKCNELIEGILDADGVVLGSPVYFAGANGALCALLDRVFYATTCIRDAESDMPGQLFKGKWGASVVTRYRLGGTASLDRLNRYFIASQMPIVSSSDYMAFCGNLLEDESGAEEIAILKTLGRNMGTLLRAGTLCRK